MKLNVPTNFRVNTTRNDSRRAKTRRAVTGVDYGETENRSRELNFQISWTRTTWAPSDGAPEERRHVANAV